MPVVGTSLADSEEGNAKTMKSYAEAAVGFQTCFLPLGSWTGRIPVSASGIPESWAMAPSVPLKEPWAFHIGQCWGSRAAELGWVPTCLSQA